MTASSLVPVTVIGGYLGAGKTTVLNRLLAGDHGRRLAVLVNDFGAINIDADLIAAHDGDTISLENGCVCCSIADALGEALDRVLALEPPPDQIVIEASGVADPAKIAHYGRGWPGCRLDAIVVLADAESIRTQAGDRFVGELVTRQLRGADVVVLTKVDLVDDATLDELQGWVAATAGGESMVLRAAHGVVDPAVILDAKPGRLPQVEVVGGAESDADVLFDSFVLEIGEPLDRARLEAALAEWPASVARVKGIVDVAGEGRVVVHRVGRRWSTEPALAAMEASATRLVVIGPSDTIDPEQLLADLMRPIGA